jgi:DNA-binding CsgD family transcriptional regulator
MSPLKLLKPPPDCTCSEADLELGERLLCYSVHVDSLATPEAVLDRLHDITSAALGLNVLLAGRFPNNVSDWKSLSLGKNVFLHHTAPKGWWEEWVRRAPRQNPIAYFLARLSLAPYTLSEMSRLLEPIGTDRWGIELAMKYGIRDAFICPVGARWVIAFWSPRVLTKIITEPHRIMLFSAASFAAIRLEQLASILPEAAGSYIALTPREIAVIRFLSWGKTYRQIAQALGLSAETVRTHLKKAKEKLGARSQAHIVAQAMRQRVIS